MYKRRVGIGNNIKFNRKRCKHIQNMIFFLYFPSLNFHICKSRNFKFFFCASLFYFYTYIPYKAFVLELLQIAKAEFENRQLGYFLITKKVASTSNNSLALVSHFYPTFLNKTKNVVASKGDSITMAVYIPCPIWKKSTHIYLTRTYLG